MVTIPTLNDLYTGIVSDLEAEFGVTLPTFGRNILRGIAMVQAGKLKLYYLVLGKVQKNQWVTTADPVAQGGTLEEFGEVKLDRLPFPATQGQYSVEVTGTVAATIAAGTTFKSNDEALNPGKLFILDTALTFASATETITLRALVAGIESRLEVGDLLTATVPLPNVDQEGAVTAETVIPQAAEEIEEYREKVIEAYRLEAQGGSSADYRLWSSDAQGVEQVYPYATSGQVNEVDVYVEATIADSIDGMGTPTAAILSDVSDVIDINPDTLQGRRPIQVTVNVIAITVREITYEIQGYVGSTATIEATITAALKEYTDAVRPFISGADVVAERNDYITYFNAISAIQNAVPGGFFNNLVIRVDGVLTTSFQFVGGNIPFQTSVTFT